MIVCGCDCGECRNIKKSPIEAKMKLNLQGVSLDIRLVTGNAAVGGVDPGGGAGRMRGQSWIHIAFCAKQKSGVRSNNGVFSLFPGSFQNSLPNLSPSTLPTPWTHFKGRFG